MAKRKTTDSPRFEHPTGRAFTPNDVARRGVVSSRQFSEKQGVLPGTEHLSEGADFRPLSRWEDLPAEHRQRVEHNLATTYGITMRNAIHNHGVLIDKAVSAAAESGAKGQRFYRGEGDDPHDDVGRILVARAAKQHNIPYHVAVAARGVLSPRSNVHDEIYNLHLVAAHLREHPDHMGPVPGAVGMNAGRRSAKAVAVLQAHRQGVHPLDAKDPSDPKGKRLLIDPKTNPKVVSYIQSYTHPDHPLTRTAVDTHAVGGIAPHLPKTAPKVETRKYDSRGRPFKQPVGKGHPDWVPNQEDALEGVGHYEFFDHAQRVAAQKRGLAPTEAQSLAWHVERSRHGQQPGTGNAASRQKSRQHSLF